MRKWIGVALCLRRKDKILNRISVGEGLPVSKLVEAGVEDFLNNCLGKRYDLGVITKTPLIDRDCFVARSEGNIERLRMVGKTVASGVTLLRLFGPSIRATDETSALGKLVDFMVGGGLAQPVLRKVQHRVYPGVYRTTRIFAEMLSVVRLESDMEEWAKCERVEPPDGEY